MTRSVSAGQAPWWVRDLTTVLNPHRHDLTDEQERFVSLALDGRNVLVEACVGSGKTTAIQELCDRVPSSWRVLYLTYNKLLKQDARDKISHGNVTVTNYHGLAWSVLRRAGVESSVSDLCDTLCAGGYPVGHYDLVVVDEYQDLDQSLADVLTLVCEQNPGIQIVAVGDMAQKIYDRTTLDAHKFMSSLMGEHDEMAFTKCFRLPADFAERLGRVWHKDIRGVNPDCEVVYVSEDEAYADLLALPTSDVLCLGATYGGMTRMLNRLESGAPYKYNKQTTWAKSRVGRSSPPTPPAGAAVFTTYDGCKGMERPVAFVFDWTVSYWNARTEKPCVSTETLRNLFCVAVSRGKRRIEIVRDSRSPFVGAEQLMAPESRTAIERHVGIDSMLDFKRREDIEACHAALEVSEPYLLDGDDGHVIKIVDHDRLIDLVPVAECLVRAAAVPGYNIDTDIVSFASTHRDRHVDLGEVSRMTDRRKALYLVSLVTNQERYLKQVTVNPVSDMAAREARVRVARAIDADTAEIQTRSKIVFPFDDGSTAFTATGNLDAVQDGVAWSVVFCDDVSHDQLVALAAHMVAQGLDEGRILDVRDGSVRDVHVPDRKALLDAVANCVTKGAVPRWYDDSPYDESNMDDEIEAEGVLDIDLIDD